MLEIFEKIKSYLEVAPKIDDLFVFIGFVSFSLVLLFRSAGTTWWDISLSNFQSLLLCIVGFFIGLIYGIKFLTNLINANRKKQLGKKAIKRIIIILLTWIFFIFIIILKKIGYINIPGWLIFIAIIGYVFYLFLVKEEFNFIPYD